MISKTPGLFSADYCLTAEYCDQKGTMSALAPFVICQALAMRHNEVVGNGVKAMAEQEKFWLVVHSRIDYYAPAELMQHVTAETWPERSEEHSIRCYRDYRIRCGEKLLCEGRTQWAICSRTGRILPFSQSGFGQDFPYPEQTVNSPYPIRFKETIPSSTNCSAYTVRRSDLDFVGHMNNVSYVRMLLDSIPDGQFGQKNIRSIEIHYSHPCLENESVRLISFQTGEKLCFLVWNDEEVVLSWAIVEFM